MLSKSLLNAFGKFFSLFAVTILLTSIVFSEASVAGCQGTQVSACSSTSASACGSGTATYQITGTSPNYQTTYCTQCSVCIPGSSDCVKGALGCNACQEQTSETVTGVQCVSVQGACTASGTTCSYTN